LAKVPKREPLAGDSLLDL